MYLYQEKENHFNIYNFRANNEDLKKYRQEEMKQIKEDERILQAKAKINFLNEEEVPLFEKFARSNLVLDAYYADNRQVFSNSFCEVYHYLEQDKKTKENCQKLLNLYYQGFFSDTNIIRIQYSHLIKYYLPTQNEYAYSSKGEYIMKNILQLPKSLYLLQLIGQGRFNEIINEDISSQLDLYTIDKIEELKKDEIKKLDNLHITDNIYSDMANKAKSNELILTKILKR